MKTFELAPSDGRKSFYGKCVVTEELINGEVVSKLTSYETVVASYNHTTNEITINGWYSNTTQSHINAFLSYYGFDEMNKSDFKRMGLI